MASSGRFVRNHAGYREVLRGPDATSVCAGAAASGAASANAMGGPHANYTTVNRGGRNRVHYWVMSAPGDYAAAGSERKNGVLRRLSISIGG